MAKIRIPESGNAALKSLNRLTDEQFDQLIHALRESPPTASPPTFWQRVSDRLPSVPSPAVERIVDELFSINSARENSGLPAEEFGRMMGNAISEQGAELGFDAEAQRRVKVRLAQLLELKASLSLTSKALDVLTDAERIFYSAKVLTDVRPVFDDAGEVVQAAVILHNLRIHFGQDSDHHDFVVALDEDDITQLREVLDRAERKAEALKALLKAANVPYLAVDE